MTKQTVVLLHGAGMGSWIWERVTPLIAPDTVTLDVPARTPHATPAGCASSLVSAIDDRGLHRVVLVMHSLAGVLAADLARLLGERLTACVYIAAVIPGEGSNFAKAAGFPGRLLLPILFRLHPDGLTPSEAMIRRALCVDLNEQDSARVVENYMAEFPGLYLSKVGAPPKCKSVYVKLSEDKSVSPSLQSRMVARLESPQVSEIQSGHLAMLSHPEELAAIINGIAART